jgi:type I restriction enzyme M protein
VSLSSTIKAIQDIMRKDVGVDGDAQRIGQLTWLLFLKIWDDREQELELIEAGFQSPLMNVRWREGGEPRQASDLRWRAWAEDPEGMTGDSLVNFIDSTLFPALKEMEFGPAIDAVGEGSEAASALRRRRLLIRGVFEDAYQYMKSGTLLRQVINRLQADIDFNDARSRHLFGEIYEQVLRDLQSAGNAGEYYTPRAVTQFAVDMVNPRLGDTILDPACGTGGFLAGAIEHIRRNDVHTADQESQLQASIQGVEKKPLPHLLCTTNLIVHGIDVPVGIRHGNALARPIREISARDRVDVILTNPPFGGMEEDGIENNFPLEFRTRETADLFLVLILEQLRPGGRAAIVLPDGSLFGEGIKTRIKERLLAECNLHTIVRLPAGVFSPYTSIRTNILFFEKGTPTQEVWYFEHPYPEGYKSYSKTKPMLIEEFGPEKEWWTNRSETPRAWRVSIDELRSRGFNLDVPNPSASSQLHLDPEVLLEQLDSERAAVAHSRQELSDLLKGALADTTWGKAAERIDEMILGSSDVSGLRELVLTLAVQGRLVPQNLSDEPASALIDRIKRMPSNASDRSGNGQLTRERWQLPATWVWTQLGQLATFAIGRTPPTKDAEFWSDREGFPWVAISDMSHYGVVSSTRRKVTQRARDAVFRSAPAPAGTMLMSFKLTIGKIARLGVAAYHNEAIAAIHPRLPELDPYLFRFLPIFAIGGETNAAIKGSTLNASSLHSLSVALPPPQEQERIRARADLLLNIIDRIESQLLQVARTQESFKSSVLGHLDTAKDSVEPLTTSQL